MSTILDALKKVQQERESPREQLLHTTESRPQRRTSPVMVAACAVLGFAAGVGLALQRGTRPESVGESPTALASPALELPEVSNDQPPEPAPGELASAKTAAEPAEAPVGDNSERIEEEHPAPPPAASTDSAVPTAMENPSPVPGAPLGTGSALDPSPFAPPHESANAAPPAQIATRQPVERPVPPVPAVREEDPAAAFPESPEPEIEPESAAEPQPEAPTITEVDTGRSPPGVPRVSLSFLQWSPDPARRFAFVSVDGAPSLRVREGDTMSGLTVAQITPTGVQFKSDTTLFTIRPRH